MSVDIDKSVYSEQGKSALWSHLLHYQAAQGKMEAPAESSGQYMTGVFLVQISAIKVLIIDVVFSAHPGSNCSSQRMFEDGTLLLRGSLIQDMR